MYSYMNYTTVCRRIYLTISYMSKPEQRNPKKPTVSIDRQYIKVELLATIDTLTRLGTIYAWAIPAMFDHMSRGIFLK